MNEQGGKQKMVFFEQKVTVCAFFEIKVNRLHRNSINYERKKKA